MAMVRHCFSPIALRAGALVCSAATRDPRDRELERQSKVSDKSVLIARLDATRSEAELHPADDDVFVAFAEGAAIQIGRVVVDGEADVRVHDPVHTDTDRDRLE